MWLPAAAPPSVNRGRGTRLRPWPAVHSLQAAQPRARAARLPAGGGQRARPGGLLAGAGAGAAGAAHNQRGCARHAPTPPRPPASPLAHKRLQGTAAPAGPAGPAALAGCCLTTCPASPSPPCRVCAHVEGRACTGAARSVDLLARARVAATCCSICGHRQPECHVDRLPGGQCAGGGLPGAAAAGHQRRQTMSARLWPARRWEAQCGKEPGCGLLPPCVPARCNMRGGPVGWAPGGWWAVMAAYWRLWGRPGGELGGGGGGGGASCRGSAALGATDQKDGQQSSTPTGLEPTRPKP